MHCMRKHQAMVKAQLDRREQQVHKVQQEMTAQQVQQAQQLALGAGTAEVRAMREELEALRRRGGEGRRGRRVVRTADDAAVAGPCFVCCLVILVSMDDVLPTTASSSAAVILADLSTALRACGALAGVATAEMVARTSDFTAVAKEHTDAPPMEPYTLKVAISQKMAVCSIRCRRYHR